jgi:hypothetical protein
MTFPVLAKVPLMTLTVRTSKNGNQYLSGFLGQASVVEFKGKTTYYGETWNIFLQERPAKNGQQGKPAPVQNTAPHQAHDFQPLSSITGAGLEGPPLQAVKSRAGLNLCKTPCRGNENKATPSESSQTVKQFTVCMRRMCFYDCLEAVFTIRAPNVLQSAAAMSTRWSFTKSGCRSNRRRLKTRLFGAPRPQR